MKWENVNYTSNTHENIYDENVYKEALQCSCAKCEAFLRLHLKNNDAIPYDTCATGSNDSNRVIERISSNKTFKIDTNIDTCYEELVRKEITYDEKSDIDVVLPKTLKQESLYSGASCDSTQRMFDGSRSNIPTEMASLRSNTKVSFPKDLDSTKIKLSAQIMNVPYRDFKDTLYAEKPKNSYIGNKLTRFDILNRIKEAYKACSCKVCECIIGKTPISKNVCNCKPCECADCVAFMNNLKYGGIVARDGCPCISCNKKECMRKNKFSNAQYCDCEPSNQIKYNDTYSNPCSCKPCECIDCKLYSKAKPRNVIVSRVEEDIPHSRCNCSPCECSECVQRVPIASTLRHEMSTGISRPINCTCDSCPSQACESNGNGTCICEVQQRLMRKPVEKDTHDYDIHRASIKSNHLIENVKNNTVAMFAAISNNYLKSVNKSRSCDCEQCECIVCKEDERTTNKVSVLLQELDSTQKFTKQGYCKCLPCECEVCCRENISNHTICQNAKACNCEVCDCLQCDNPNKKNDQYTRNKKIMKKISFSKKVCKCESCECQDCESLMYKCPGEACSCFNCKCKMCTDEGMFYNKFNKSYKKFPQRLENNIHNDHTNGQPATKMKNFKVVKPIENSCHHANNNVNLKKDYIRVLESVYKPKRIESMNNADSKVHVEINHEPNEYNLKTSTASGSFIADRPLVTPIHENKILHRTKNNNDFYSRKEVDKCLNDVMESDLYEPTAFDEINTLDNISSQCSDINEDNKETSAKVFEAPENSKPFLTSTDVKKIKDLTIDKLLTLKKSIIDNNNSKLWKQNTEIKTMSIDLLNSLRTANTKLDTIYNKLHTTPKKTLPGNEGDIIQSNTENKFQDARKDGEKSQNNNDIQYNVDFEKANRTLQEAKAFSIELIKLLKIYEKANKKCTNARQFDKRYSNIAICYDGNKSSCNLADKDRLSELPPSNDRKVRRIYNKDAIGLPKTTVREKATGDISDQNNMKARPEFPSSFTVNHHGEHINEPFNYDRGSQFIYSNSKPDICHLTTIKSSHSYNSNSCNECERFEENKPEHMNEWNKENRNKKANNGGNNYKSKKSYPISTSTLTADQTDVTVMEQMNEMLKKKFIEKESYQKKSFLNSQVIKPLRNISILTLEVQNAMRPFLRPNDQDNDTSSKYEINIQNKKISSNRISLERNNVFTDSTQTCKMNEDAEKGVDCTDLSFGSTAKSSCDFLKVKILGLRRISNHTVFVKWKSPQDVNNVNGYELLVDGRAVQKILSPCRCMAVISNLPHLEQVLITIRTLTTKCGHFPAATIVYR